MAADVSTLVRLLSRYDRDDGVGEEGSTKADLVTKDLLGGCCVVGGGAAPSPVPKKVPFPGFHVLSNGEKHLQAMDLNLPPLWSSAPPPPVRAASLETSAPTLDLTMRSLAAPPPASCQSVCTLEKVKSALERSERESRLRRRQLGGVQAGSASPTSSSTTTSSAKRRLGGGAEECEESWSRPAMEAAETNGDGGAAAEMAAAGCPSCLMYVLISRSNPRCPRCSSSVSLPPAPPPLPEVAGKKARIDLNADATWNSPTRTVNFF